MNRLAKGIKAVLEAVNYEFSGSRGQAEGWKFEYPRSM